MDVIEALAARFSCRAYTPQRLDQGTVEKIMEAALRAPSWANTQPWEVFVASGEALDRIRRAYLAKAGEGSMGNPDFPAPESWPPEIQQRMQAAMAERFAALGIDRLDEAARKANVERGARFFDAPAVVWLCLDRRLTPWSLFDLGALSQSIMLAAQQYGVASVPAFMFARFPEVVRAELAIPDHLAIAIGLALGYPDREHVQNKFRSKRRPVSEVVRFKGF